MFISYDIALEISGLSKLSERRQAHCLTFAKRCLRNQQTARMFPLNPEALQNLNLRHTEKYKVNFSHTENYKKSAVPFCQRLLNQDCINQKQKERKLRKKLKRGQGRGHSTPPPGVAKQQQHRRSTPPPRTGAKRRWADSESEKNRAADRQEQSKRQKSAPSPKKGASNAMVPVVTA